MGCTCVVIQEKEVVNWTQQACFNSVLCECYYSKLCKKKKIANFDFGLMYPFLSTQCTGEKIFSLAWEAVEALEMYEIPVVSLTSDGAKPMQPMFLPVVSATGERKTQSHPLQVLLTLSERERDRGAVFLLPGSQVVHNKSVSLVLNRYDETCILLHGSITVNYFTQPRNHEARTRGSRLSMSM